MMGTISKRLMAQAFNERFAGHLGGYTKVKEIMRDRDGVGHGTFRLLKGQQRAAKRRFKLAMRYRGSVDAPVFKGGRILHLFCGAHGFGYGR